MPPNEEPKEKDAREILEDMTILFEETRGIADQNGQRIDQISASLREAVIQINNRIDQISASLREVVMRPVPDLSKGVTTLVMITITVSLASLALTITTITILVEHMLGR